MEKSESLSLAERIKCIGEQAPPVRQRRDAYLAARGQVETLVLYGLLSAQRLAHGRYQTALTSPIANKNDLAPIAAQELTEAVEALGQALPVLIATMDDCAEWTVSQAAPPAVAQIASELDECTRRLKVIKSLLGEWNTKLTEYTQETALRQRRSTTVAPPLEPLDPPDPT